MEKVTQTSVTVRYGILCFYGCLLYWMPTSTVDTQVIRFYRNCCAAFTGLRLLSYNLQVHDSR